MLGILGGDDRCPIARSLDVLGEKWTLMIVRDALAGATRFGQFQASLGIPREVLTARLGSLLEGGVLERRSYKPESGRTREEYVLTDAGRDLAVVLLALGGWAERHRVSRRRALLSFVDAESGRPLVAVAATGGDTVVPSERIRARLDRAATESDPPLDAHPIDEHPHDAHPIDELALDAHPHDAHPLNAEESLR